MMSGAIIAKPRSEVNERPRLAWVPHYHVRRLDGTVAIEIAIDAIEGKFKLSQNRSAADRAGVIARLRESGRDGDASLARLMKAGAPRT